MGKHSLGQLCWIPRHLAMGDRDTVSCDERLRAWPGVFQQPPCGANFFLGEDLEQGSTDVAWTCPGSHLPRSVPSGSLGKQHWNQRVSLTSPGPRPCSLLSPLPFSSMSLTADTPSAARDRAFLPTLHSSAMDATLSARDHCLSCRSLVLEKFSQYP